MKHKSGKTSTKGRGRMRGDRSDTHTKRDHYYNVPCEWGKHSTEIKKFQSLCSVYLKIFFSLWMVHAETYSDTIVNVTAANKHTGFS